MRDYLCEHQESELKKNALLLIVAVLLFFTIREVTGYFFKTNLILSRLDSQNKKLEAILRDRQ